MWDVVAGKPEHTWTHHADKVQAVAWNRQEAHVLLTGSFDKTATLVRPPPARPPLVAFANALRSRGAGTGRAQSAVQGRAPNLLRGGHGGAHGPMIGKR